VSRDDDSGSTPPLERIRVALDLDGVPASRLLGDLVERGILLKTSDAQRGPSVTYGAGPAFPAAPTRRRPKPPRPTAPAPNKPEDNTTLF